MRRTLNAILPDPGSPTGRKASVDVVRMAYNYVLFTLAQSMDSLEEESGVDCVPFPRPLLPVRHGRHLAIRALG